MAPPPTSLQQLRALVSAHDVRAVVSDLDGVLRVFDPSLWDRLDHRAGVAPGTAFAAILGHPFLEEVTRGRGTHAQWRERCVDELVAQGAAPAAARETVRLWAGTPARLDREVLAHLLRFREDGLGVFVLTNGTDRVPEELDELGLTGFLGPRRRFLLNTADLGAAKPEREAFARAHARLTQELTSVLRPDQVAFLDDSAGHVRGAEEFGWRAVRHDRG
ncbi:haloacid dehalogenase [Brachybacterium sp. P6-10-X1]|uniref:HAD family hydrolase n=1 Tax=Brachybacterium sp. P6-10-X1 TaxID=1903186 RepID=UPI00097198F9|nr:HAD family hydrolase [Brachybacterium sp. P6-10-X1]APX32096.1 haloacid dehalogenase [Brachybacterium sp. P6-10-X1]